MTKHAEYMRRNLHQAGSVGAVYGLTQTIERLEALKHTPQWLIDNLSGVLMRIEGLPSEMAQWRNIAPDAPKEGDF